jgi:hypothetical protein
VQALEHKGLPGPGGGLATHAAVAHELAALHHAHADTMASPSLHVGHALVLPQQPQLAWQQAHC